MRPSWCTRSRAKREVPQHNTTTPDFALVCARIRLAIIASAGSPVSSVVVPVSWVLYSQAMGDRSTTLGVGDPAPDFQLPMANSTESLSLTVLRQHGPVIVEFLRGTW